MDRVLTIEEKLLMVFDYNPESGEFHYKSSRPLSHFKTVPAYKRWHTMYAGRLVFNPHCFDKRIYNRLNLEGRKFAAHRVAFLFVNGVWPSGEVDHINRNGLDNRFSNLRDVERSENMRNASLHSNNKSGVKGVCWRKDSKKWVAYGCTLVDGVPRKIYLGMYEELHLTVKARREWESIQGSIYHGTEEVEVK